MIVSSIKADYSCEELVGKKIIVLCNLTPARLTGVTSEGMLLAATNSACGCQVIFVFVIISLNCFIIREIVGANTVHPYGYIASSFELYKPGSVRIINEHRFSPYKIHIRKNFLISARLTGCGFWPSDKEWGNYGVSGSSGASGA